MEDKLIDLEDRRKVSYINQQLEAIGLEDERIGEDKVLSRVGIDTMAEFFKRKDEKALEIGEWISNNTQTTKDRAMFWSVMCEHFQNLLSADEDHLQDLFMKTLEKRDEESIVREALEEIDKWIFLADQFENFQMASMRDYLIESLEKKRRKYNNDD